MSSLAESSTRESSRQLEPDASDRATSQRPAQATAGRGQTLGRRPLPHRAATPQLGTGWPSST